MMEAIRSSETLVLTRATPGNIPEDDILHFLTMRHALRHIRRSPKRAASVWRARDCALYSGGGLACSWRNRDRKLALRAGGISWVLWDWDPRKAAPSRPVGTEDIPHKKRNSLKKKGGKIWSNSIWLFDTKIEWPTDRRSWRNSDSEFWQHSSLWRDWDCLLEWRSQI
jgi:hypothetical protein